MEKKSKVEDDTSASLSGIKRQREEEEEEEEVTTEFDGADHTISLENDLTFSDTLVALRIMRAQFPHLHKIGHVVKRMELKMQDGSEVFEWFRAHVIPSKLETSIGHEELCSLLSSQGKVKDQHISLLINAGLLTRQLIDSSMYWFAIPSVGSVLKGLSQGRKELLSFLNRRKYKEMMLADLEKKRLRLSPLDMRFHLRDLIGSCHLKTIQTASGLVVRVIKE